jgi:hypothetical protein
LNPATKLALVELATKQVRNDDDLQATFEEQGIHTIDIWKVFSEILDKDPIIAMPIDEVADDLTEWAKTLKADVRPWIVRKLVEFGHPETIMYEFPDNEFQDKPGPDGGPEKPSVTLVDLLRAGVLKVDEKLTMSYKPKLGQQKTYEGTVREDGSIEVLGKKFGSPSYAALYAMQDAGKTGKTANGWPRWKTASGKTLDDLRQEYLAKGEATSV